MQALSSLPSFPSAADLQLSTGAFRSSDLRRLDASTETHTDLSVVTAGGDRVTLSAESLLRASYADLNYQSTDQRYHLNLDATDSEVQVKNSIEVSIEGQLDQQEEADLQRLMGKLEKVVKKFLRGDIEGALSRALKIGDLGTVESFQLTVQHSEQIAITEEQYVSADGFQALRPQNVDTEDSGKASSVADQIVNTIQDTKIDIKKLLKRLPYILKHLFEKLDAKVSDQGLAQLSSDIETSLQRKVPPDRSSD
jgi:hypothetical protein